jgi:phosphatidylserine/phosphatidylglycerophosphate/cardiolipin synthase-like enzyme
MSDPTSWDALSLPALERLAWDLKEGRVEPPWSASRLRQYAPGPALPALLRELDALTQEGMKPAHIAHLLGALVHARAQQRGATDRVALVWSGPEVAGMESRDTAIVVREMLQQAQRGVLLVSYVFDRHAKARALLEPLEAQRRRHPALEVKVVVNVERAPRDERPEAELLREAAQALRQTFAGLGAPPNIYYDPRALAERGDKARASMHAKCLVVDARDALLTSANFTQAAQHRNIEAGVRVQDPHFAGHLCQQFERLIQQGLLVGL